MHRAKPLLGPSPYGFCFDESEEPKREQAAGDCSIELGGLRRESSAVLHGGRMWDCRVTAKRSELRATRRFR